MTWRSRAGSHRWLNRSYDAFLSATQASLAALKVDEAWYLQRYDDVAKAVVDDPTRSARQHFLHSGYFEGRLPFPMIVDERWYLTNYPDVAENVRRGNVASAQEHFEANGYREGRLPFKL